ncbi:WhiB family transcriptional regulator [Blastococcus mobilis]|uniref:Transcriptional regulator WhiB n=1 Tax=Blastococcus mobilis TaxID=1938746 RepID=A0A238VHD7_9ACTN|nr:WhiB family transcriptional regulator [Blastococcus mobilis]SNR32919.1 Transcription factor WhiB [Blastococcus mobilis]
MSSPTLLRPPDWTRQAACQGISGRDLDPWHPPEHLTAAEQATQHALARLVCARCPVRHPCALEALQAGIGHGVWGGLTVADRRRIARRHGYPQPGAAQHGTRARYIAGCTDGPDGKACRPCLEAHRRWVAEQRARTAARKAAVIPPPALVLVLGHGRRRAYPGQYVLFTDGLPAHALLRPADTGGRTVAA